MTRWGGSKIFWIVTPFRKMKFFGVKNNSPSMCKTFNHQTRRPGSVIAHRTSRTALTLLTSPRRYLTSQLEGMWHPALRVPAFGTAGVCGTTMWRLAVHNCMWHLALLIRICGTLIIQGMWHLALILINKGMWHLALILINKGCLLYTSPSPRD